MAIKKKTKRIAKSQNKLSKTGKKVFRKILRAGKKIAKADKIMDANRGVKGKKAGAARTSAVRKYKSAQRKLNKADGIIKGLKGKAKRNPQKADAQKAFGRKTAKNMKLIGKADSLVGSKKRVAKRTKHLTRRINK
jgi:uncharacterized protein with GYD domain